MKGMGAQQVILCLSAFMFVPLNARLTVKEKSSNSAFDLDLYDNVLDSELCQRQIRFMTANSTVLLAQFLDAGLRLPRGFFDGNSEDFGNYYQCLGIDAPFEESNIAGKYCIIQVPLSQNLNLPGFSSTADAIDINSLNLGPAAQLVLEKYYAGIKGYRVLSGSHFDDSGSAVSGTVFRLAVCIPRPCTTQEAVNTLLFNLTAIGFHYEEEFCRLPNDKPWVPADFAAAVVFSAITFLTILSTVYELSHIFVFKRDPKHANTYLRSFSIYNNTQRLLSFSQGGDNLNCMDGIRTIATVWIIVGHAFSSLSGLLNPFKAWSWMISAQGLWVSSAPISVDTFILLTGILLVYTTAKKMDGMKLIRNMHVFYLNRLVRMFPLLATAVLLDASIFHKVADGPHWVSVANNARRCRAFWWTTLLHLQNYLNPSEMCVPHSWYIAIDIQLHVLSPVVLFWVLSGKRDVACSTLMAALTLAMAGSAVYNYFMNLPAHTISPARSDQLLDYMTKYYFHIMSRITPFLVGMMFGYVLHIWRGKKVKINIIIVLALWMLCFGIISLILYMLYRVKQLDWDNQTVDTLLNTLMRPLWASAIGWMVFACVHGYGGPINWFLSLPMWRLPSRLTYGMYLFHYPIIFVVNNTALAPQFFSVPNVVYQSLSYLMLSFIVSFVLTVVIDAPFTIIFKNILDKGVVESNKAKKLEEFSPYGRKIRKDLD